MELLQCPLSYGFYASPDFTPNRSALLLSEYDDRKAGIVPPWGEGSALYHSAMRYISSLVSEREQEQLDAIKSKSPKT